jgi:hypothetical protein
MNTTYISGPIYCHILQNNNIKYYLFGDVHTNVKENSCQDMYGSSCTSINKTFDGIVHRNTNCWSIAALLYNWFQNNNKNGVSTEFFLETQFTKENERKRIKPLINIVNKRHEIKPKVLADDILDDVDDPVNQIWLLTLELLFRDCLTYDKTKCLPYVHMHYVDTRISDSNEYYISPFLIKDFTDSKHYEDILLFLYKNRHIIHDSIYMGNQDLNTVIGSLNYPDDDNFKQRFIDLSRMAVKRNGVTLHRVAAEYNRLKEIFPEIAYKLRNYIYEVLDTFDENDLDEDIFQYVSSLEMDIYTISRMFIQQNLNQSKDIIIFAGANHVSRYYEFLADILEYKQLYNSAHDEDLDIKCVQIPTKLISDKISY